MRDRRHVAAFRWASAVTALAVALLFCLPPALTVADTFSGAQAPDGPTEASRTFLPLMWADPTSVPLPTGPKDWPMAGANPQRTSWNAEEVRGRLKPVWYRPIEPYIAQNVQIIAAYGLLYVSTARGLIALEADTGATRWIYPTELPLGHSPTIDNGVAYVGGLDHKLHAIDAMTGEGLWSFTAEAGFVTNPLVARGLVYLGNRDGTMYAVHANGSPEQGQLAWKHKTGGPILFSAAYKDGAVYVASNDMHAYAFDATNGQLIWKSAKLPGAGFASWWPVVTGEQVVFVGSRAYRTGIAPGKDADDTLDVLYPNRATEPDGTFIGPVGTVSGKWAPGTKTLDASRIMEHYEAKPWRRTYFVLDQLTGAEQTFDTDRDGRPEYAPVPWHSTNSGTRYPPVVGYDGVLYQSGDYESALYIPSGHVTGWKYGSEFISIPAVRYAAVCEPLAYSAGGRLIYFSLTNDREAGAFDISLPSSAPDRQWIYYSYSLENMLPGYNEMLDVSFWKNDWMGPYGGPNGVYAKHGDENPPIPYRGKIYMHRGNAVVAFGSATAAPVKLSVLRIPDAAPDRPAPPTTDELQSRLAEEVTKIVDAGHLRPGYGLAGIFDIEGLKACGDYMVDYWRNPADMLYALTRTLPHLPAALQARTRAYLAAEFEAYPPYAYTHIGWRDGAPREAFDLPPEVDADRADFPPSKLRGSAFVGWGPGDWDNGNFPPYIFYAMWKYALTMEDPPAMAKEILTQSVNWDGTSKLEPAPSDDVLIRYPFAHNAYVAGYLGYLKLQALAGEAETASVRIELDRLLALRATSFSKDTPYGGSSLSSNYCRTLTVSRNFLFLVPELADYLRENALGKAQAAVEEYERVAPWWFVGMTQQAIMENAVQPLYDVNAMFQAKALIMKEPRAELAKYLDVPAFARGDLFYIHNLVTLLETPE